MSVKNNGTAGQGFRCTACFLAAGYLCDWRVANGGLCNKPICPDHAEQVGPNKHLCPEHQESWRAFRVARRQKEEAEQNQDQGGVNGDQTRTAAQDP